MAGGPGSTPTSPTTPAAPPAPNPPMATPASTPPIATPAATPAVATTPPPPPPPPRYRQGVLKLVVAIGLAALTCWCVIARTEHYRQAHSAPAQKQTSSSEKPEPPEILDVEKAAPEMKATNELLISWAVALLGATIGIAILAKGPKIKDKNWGLIFFPSVWVFLLASTNEGYEFKRSLTYQTAN